MIVRHGFGRDSVFAEQCRDLRGLRYHRGGAAFGVLLPQVVAVQKIDCVREGRRGYIVKQRRERLLDRAGKMPCDEADADAVPEAGISRQTAKTRKRGVFAAAVHAHAAQALHLRYGAEFAQPCRNFAVIAYRVLLCVCVHA